MLINSAYLGAYLKKFREKDRIILYGEKKLVENLKKYTEIMGFHISECYFSDVANDNSYIDIMYEETSKFFVWIVSSKCVDLGRKLDEIGLVQYRDYATVFKPPYMNLYERFPLDTHLGYTALTDKKYPGVVLFGDEDSKGEMLKIVTLGGSTSDALSYPWKSWSEILYEKFLTSGIKNVVVYSAGVSGYTSAQELLKLQRDMILVNPDIVISFSGVNDCMPKKNAWFTAYQDNLMTQISLMDLEEFSSSENIGCSNGFVENASLGDMWIRNTRMMYAVCKEFDIDFFSFMQPMIGVPGMIMKGEAKEFIDNRLDGRREWTEAFVVEMRKKIKDYDYIYDIADIFLGHEEVFIDDVHVTEEGNAIIANEIWNILNRKFNYIREE